ncbi:helix-turn-helix domain-containing protein [Sphaerisporangium corydalis]|uniref:Helix-turn-helix domain-containing protein n=1 Tax=Sphaerisporangium corydalis TaxID=1441875 RepID=A0ABV9ECZ8_9ACTN|nr:helix-turn-helix domain-containing protein [Sphaerisporangium corydalis]
MTIVKDEHGYNEGKRFGTLLRKYRNIAGLTQQELADLSAVSIRAVRDLESGRVRRPRKETVQLLARALRIEEPHREALRIAAAPPVAGMGGGPFHPVAPVSGPVSGLVGRRAEIRALEELVRSRDRRMVAVTGLGGVGKTRLALEVAARLNAKGVQVVWTPSCPHTGSRGRLVDELLRDPGADPRELGGVIGTGQTLLVIDDHDEASLPADRIPSLLARYPGLCVLLTTRGMTCTAETSVLPLAPLALPRVDHRYDAAGLAEVDAARMIMTSIGLARPRLRLDETAIATIAALCRRLDGLPAALEAAGRLTLVYTPDELLGELSRDPFWTVLSAADGSSAFKAGEVVRQAIEALEPSARDLLRSVAGHDGRWSVEDCAALAGTTPVEAARGIRYLLLRGLIRRAEHANRSYFQLLSLVRSAIVEDARVV